MQWLEDDLQMVYTWQNRFEYFVLFFVRFFDLSPLYNEHYIYLPLYTPGCLL